jgi:hypothetical protein
MRSSRRTVGGLCDGVAAYPQDPNPSLRFIELKQTVDDVVDAVDQFRKGGSSEIRSPTDSEG